ncbi:MAG: TlpA disulfide reductase family protein, partial [Nitrospinota bacterium]
MMQHVVFKRIALVAILAFLFISNPASATEPGSGEGSQNLVIEEYNGRIVYVDFWASWCVPCRKSFPWLSEMQKKYKSKGLEVVTVNLDKEKAFATKFLDEFPENNLKVVYDPDG